MSIIIDGKELSQEDCIRICEKQAADARARGWHPNYDGLFPESNAEGKAAEELVRSHQDFAFIYGKMKADNPDLRPGQLMKLAIDTHPQAHSQWLKDVREGRKSGKLEV